MGWVGADEKAQRTWEATSADAQGRGKFAANKSAKKTLTLTSPAMLTLTLAITV
jgi:hypothetical protein